VARRDDLYPIAILDRRSHTRALGHEISVARRGNALAGVPKLGDKLRQRPGVRCNSVTVDDYGPRKGRRLRHGGTSLLRHRFYRSAPIQ
jgi:hypothetical protein